MNIARSTFYYRHRAALSGKDADITDRIEAICLEFPGYGYRRVTKQLQNDELVINHKKVLRLMRESDLLCRARRKRVKTTNSKHPFPRYPNLIKDIVVSVMNQVWLADITYIRIRNGFVYLAAILDAYSRRVSGYAISTSLETSLTPEGATYGDHCPQSGARCYPSLRPGPTIRLRGVCGGASQARLQNQHGAQRQSL